MSLSSTAKRCVVWLLLALLPLRAFASVEMAVSMIDTPAAAAAAALPPCHGSAGHDGAADEATAADTSACGQVCAPALPGTLAGAIGEPLLGGTQMQTEARDAPAGVAEPFFRPPRG
jgi:hypothetical protein